MHVPPGVACREDQRSSQIKTIGCQYLKSSAGMACQGDLARHKLDAAGLGLCRARHACCWSKISLSGLVCLLLKQSVTFGIVVQDLASRTSFHQDCHDTCALRGRGHGVASLGHSPLASGRHRSGFEWWYMDQLAHWNLWMSLKNAMLVCDNKKRHMRCAVVCVMIALP